jgi:cytochrome c oxidase assembly protein subunit 15
VTPKRFLMLATLSLGAMLVVVTSGAFVRLTGSGLGCENWPRCGNTPYPEEGFHAFVEFGNRVVAATGILFALATWLASRKTAGLPRHVRAAALGAFLGGLAQIPLGGVTVILDLHPVAVMSHFLLAFVVVALAVVVAVEAWSHESGLGASVGSARIRRAVVWLGLPLCATLVVTGAVATASGPHPGASEDVERLGLGIEETVYWHVRVAAVFGICVLVLGAILIRRRRDAPGVVVVWAGLLAVLAAQAIVGEVQYRNALPWGLVLVHVILAAAIWALFVALALVLHRPPAPFVARRLYEQSRGYVQPTWQRH